MVKRARVTAKAPPLLVPGIALSEKPDVYLMALPGRWLLAHSTPSIRLEDRHKGFQRLVKVERAREIARTVLDANRTFPNAITLATKSRSFRDSEGRLAIPDATLFLVVDGQHRLWAQKYSEVEGIYPCVIHMERTERDMASLFLEINDNQRRVPSSLRWDLVRLVRPDDQSTVFTSELVYDLATRPESPFCSVGIDMTGEQKLSIKQGSLAPEIRSLVSRQLKRNDAEYDDLLGLLVRFFVAVRSLDPDGWGDVTSTFYKPRVLRALIRILGEMLTSKRAKSLTAEAMRRQLTRIDRDTLSEENVRRMQGSAGVQDLFQTMKTQIFG